MPQEPRHVKHSLGQPGRLGQPGQAAAPFQVPPPARAMPGITGNPPLPAARPIIVKSATAAEQAVLRKAGWTPGQAIPSDLATQIAAMQDDARASLQEMPLPVPADTPPLQVPSPVDISKLPPSKQQEIEDLVSQAKAQALLNAQRRAQPQFSHPSVAQAVQEAQRAINEDQTALPVVDDTGEAVYDGTNVPKQSGTFATPTGRTLVECPHCGWDLNVADEVKPTDADKQNFLQAILGNIPFEKVYTLFNGQLDMTIRTLRPDELDACYRQVYIERKRHEIENEKDFWEGLTRNRLCLQLCDIRSGSMISNELPRSLAKWSHGQPPLQTAAVDPDADTVVKRIREYVYENILKTETMARLVASTVADFNRLVTKLEANAARPDFWAATSPAT